MMLPSNIPQFAFRQWIGQSLENRRLLVVTAAVSLIQFAVYKYLYPYPNFLPDSYSYLEAAFNNQSINMWPIGYSKFLRLFSCFTRSHTALVLFQYLFLQAAILYFLFTIAYLFRPGKWMVRILFGCSVLNPVLLPVSNFVSSDALFAALSLIWFTQLLWIICQPTMNLLLLHALVLLLTFTVRYNALYYPLISLPVIAWHRMPINAKLAGMVAAIVLPGIFIMYTRHQYRNATGTAQFSAFGGWQLASNTLFAYAHVQTDERKNAPAAFQALHALVNRHNDSLSRLKDRPDARLGIYYLWDAQAPLKKYMNERYRKDSTTNGFARWAAMGPLYARYGAFLIQQYPGVFARHYVWPNMINYYVPPAEFLASYNMGKDRMEPVSTAWFGLKSNKVYARMSDAGNAVMKHMPVLLAIVNLLFVLGFTGFVLLGGYTNSPRNIKQVWCCMLVIWLCNFGFSVLASPVVLRYQVFPAVITCAFLVLLAEYLVQQSMTIKNKEPEYQDQFLADPIPNHVL